MSLYLPGAFQAPDRAAISRLVHDFPFATLVTPGVAEPFISHLPLLLMPDCEPWGTLIGHMARANPHWSEARGRESVAVFHGPHAYVSPSWYTEPAAMVPTWNYAVVHAHGVLEPVEDRKVTEALMDILIQRFEGGREAPWTLGLAPRQHDAMMGAIVAFRMRVRRVEGKFKLSQNRSPDDRVRVAEALAREPHEEARATAAWMQIYAQARRDGDDGAT